VEPVGTRQETGYVLLAMLVVSLGFGILLVHRTRPEKATRLDTYQISAYSELNSFEQGIFSDLYPESAEIEAMHDLDDAWPQIADLEEFYLAPFLKDAVWERRGKLAWSMKNDDQPGRHMAAYIGTTSDSEVSGSFLLLLSHHHDEEETVQDAVHPGEDEEEHSTIWYAPGNAPAIPNDLIEQNLIAKGWQEVIPYKGEEEIQRLKGGVL
jgi:hypothetical protein